MSIEILSALPNKNQYDRKAVGNISASTAVVTVTGLKFRPKKVILFLTNDINNADFYILSDNNDLSFKNTNGPILQGSDLNPPLTVTNKDGANVATNRITSDGFTLNVHSTAGNYNWFAWG